MKYLYMLLVVGMPFVGCNSKDEPPWTPQPIVKSQLYVGDDILTEPSAPSLIYLKGNADTTRLYQWWAVASLMRMFNNPKLTEAAFDSLRAVRNYDTLIIFFEP